MTRYNLPDFAEVEVSPTMDCLGEQPWYVKILPVDNRLPKRSVFIIADCALNAASDAVSEYKEEHNLNPSTIWCL